MWPNNRIHTLPPSIGWPVPGNVLPCPVPLPFPIQRHPCMAELGQRMSGLTVSAAGPMQVLALVMCHQCWCECAPWGVCDSAGLTEVPCIGPGGGKDDSVIKIYFTSYAE